MIYREVTLGDFREAFEALRPDNFSYDGLTALYEYLDNLYNDLDEAYDLDIIELCSDFTEYRDFGDFQADYPDVELQENIDQHTTVIGVDGGGLIVQNF